MGNARVMLLLTSITILAILIAGRLLREFLHNLLLSKRKGVFLGTPRSFFPLSIFVPRRMGAFWETASSCFPLIVETIPGPLWRSCRKKF